MKDYEEHQKDKEKQKLMDEVYKDMIDIFFSGIKERKEYHRVLKEQRDTFNILDYMKSKEEYIERANSKYADKRKEANSYFNDDEPIVTGKKNKVIKYKKSQTNLENTQPNENDEILKKQIAMEKNLKLKELIKRIEEAPLIDESKLVLKKMIFYAKRYSDGVVKNYIPFNMRIYVNNDETLYEIINIIIDGFAYFKYAKNDQYTEQSFYIIEDGNNINDLYNNLNSFVVLKDVDGILNKDKVTKDKLLKILEKNIYAYSTLEGITTIISDKNKEIIDQLFENNFILKDKVFDFELISTSANVQEIYHKVLKTLKNEYKVSEKFEIKLLDYITETFPKSQLPAPEYAQSLIEQILFNQTTNTMSEKTIPKYEKNKSISEIFKDMNELIGLENIKIMLKDLVSLMEFKNKTEDSLKLKDTNLHMVFLGNPGTGKTTVARMVAGILYNLKYIRKNKVIEVSAKDLIGEYVGQTAPKTNEVIKRALGGVLFIDEAYSLASKSNGNSFNDECIATLIQAMENYRDDLVVIFAGYSKEMDAFLKSNSGIVSRIGYTMDFKDYTLEELLLILKSMFQKSGFIVEEDAIEKAKTIIEEHRHSEGFGNARFVRNLYEKTVIKHATNMKNITSKNKLKTITEEDITDENLIKL